MEFIIDGFINNDTPFQLDFDNEDDARKEFELRKISCVEVNLSSSNGQEIDTFNKPFNVG
mgnify:FL=1|jgi:hypothetical protein|tara:strand:+ start:367 stop:546 length:180 start_codon:yes stop_codon:yes gene_type:complete